MDYTDRDITAMRQQGDVADFVKLVGGLNVTTARRQEETVTCPWCKASPGNRCTTPRGHRLPSGIHDARIRAYRNTNPQEKAPGTWPTA